MKKIRKVISFSLMFVCLSAVLTACGNFSGEDLFDLPDTSEIKTYTNPIASVLRDGETWQNYGIGDPFVMRYDGKYYLYPSTKDGSTQIKCWSSEDLVNWTYEGVCCSDETCTGAYAPEVCYYNGMFYMYSSPAGKGHYVYSSKNPTGPFECQTVNLGRSIDGSVCIAQNGKWYFYTAGGSSIVCYPMRSPTEMGAAGAGVGANMNNNWTEGPSVVYHDGVYFLTYTGNHVLSKSYRIDYAFSEDTPTSFQAAKKTNPAMISTNSKISGIGHSSTVKGPDLDGYYIVYHSLVGTMPNREMNIDRLYFNGTTMEVAGPIVGDQQAPLLPDIYAQFDDADDLEKFNGTGNVSDGTVTLTDGKKLITKKAFTGSRFTMEYSLTGIADGVKAGAIFAYTDDDNFGKAVVDPANQKLIVTLTVNGEAETKEFDLIKSFGQDMDFSFTQMLQIEKNGKEFVFYVNDLMTGTVESALGNGSFGFTTEGGDASFGYLGVSDEFGGSGAGDMYKSVSTDEGRFYAIYCSNEEYESVVDGSLTYLVGQKGRIYNYRILADSSGSFDFNMCYNSKNGAEIQLYLDGEKISGAKYTLAASEENTIFSSVIPLTGGKHVLSVKFTRGSANVKNYEILHAEKIDSVNYTFDSNEIPVYSDGTWDIWDGKITCVGTVRRGKILYGSENWDNYIVEADVTPIKDVICGLLVRAANPGTPVLIMNETSLDDISTGFDWVQGYYVGLSAESVVFGKLNYGSDFITTPTEAKHEAGKTYHMKVECLGANIKVYVDGELMIDYTDVNEPWLQGMVGFRCAAAASFDNLKVTALSAQ